MHTDLFQMAAAYLFHLVSNHPFVDGNKRVGLAVALIFLDINGIIISFGTERLKNLTLQVAQGKVNKSAIADTLREVASL